MSRKVSFSDVIQSKEIPHRDDDPNRKITHGEKDEERGYEQNLDEVVEGLGLVLKKKKPWYAPFRKSERISFAEYLKGEEVSKYNAKIIISTLENFCLDHEIEKKFVDPITTPAVMMLFHAVMRNVEDPNLKVLTALYRSMIDKINQDYPRKI